MSKENEKEDEKNNKQSMEDQNNLKVINKINNLNNENNEYDAEILYVPEEYSNYDINFKIIIIGNSGVGKTCITNNAVKNMFSDEYKSTISMEIFSLYIKIKNNNTIMKFQIWDTCGQEIYRSLITNFYRSSSLAILVYSIDQRESFDDLDLWIKELKANNSPDTKLMLVGNKLDLEDNRKVKYEEGKKLAQDFNFIGFFETSAKTGKNIKNMFLKAAVILYEEYNKYKNIETHSNLSSFKPTYGKLLPKSKNKKCC